MSFSWGILNYIYRVLRKMCFCNQDISSFLKSWNNFNFLDIDYFSSCFIMIQQLSNSVKSYRRERKLKYISKNLSRKILSRKTNDAQRQKLKQSSLTLIGFASGQPQRIKWCKYQQSLLLSNRKLHDGGTTRTKANFFLPWPWQYIRLVSLLHIDLNFLIRDNLV